MVYLALNPLLLIIGSDHRKLFKGNVHASITSSTYSFSVPVVGIRNRQSCLTGSYLDALNKYF